MGFAFVSPSTYPTGASSSNGNYARCLQQTFQFSPYLQYWVKIPLLKPLISENGATTGVSSSASSEDSWHCWNNLRTLVGHSHRLCVALELTENLPGEIFADNDTKCDAEKEAACYRMITKWSAEPVKALIIPINLFLTNKKGYPVLSKKHQFVVGVFLKFKIHVIFSGKPRHFPAGGGATSTTSPDAGNGTYVPYTQYVQFLQGRIREMMTPGEIAISSYKDTLQSPLQPLMDNLEAQTYETFENDTIKYVQYESAIASSLLSLATATSSIESNAVNPSAPGAESEPGGEQEECTPMDGVGREIVITVVGAGRGPLVAAALSAACSCNARVRIYAVEKNENAVITLRNRVMTERWSNVTVINKDMRQWVPTELADIMVSELLGTGTPLL